MNWKIRIAHIFLGVALSMSLFSGSPAFFRQEKKVDIKSVEKMPAVKEPIKAEEAKVSLNSSPSLIESTPLSSVNYAVKSPVVDIRSGPFSSSDRLTQALFNERVIVGERKGNWAMVRVVEQSRDEAGYPGWVRIDQIAPADEFNSRGGYWAVVSEPETLFYSGLSKGSTAKKVYLGVYLKYLGYVEDKARSTEDRPIYWLKCRTFDGEEGWVFGEHVEIRNDSPLSAEETADEIINTAFKFEGAPYLWGGMSKKGIDCSGLSYLAYKYNGIIIPRDADEQFDTGEPVELNKLKKGDLLFFGRNGRVTHVGIYDQDGRMINSRSSKGVIYEDLYSDYFMGMYMGARRVID